MTKGALARFVERAKTLNEALRLLRVGTPITNAQFESKPPQEGVYLFSQGAKHFYVGRTRNIRRRYRDHTSLGSRENQASFAVLLACEAIGAPKAQYTAANSRAKLYKTKEFQKAFKEAKVRVKAMQFRFVEMSNSTDQALLEIYCAVALKTRYNDFATH